MVISHVHREDIMFMVIYDAMATEKIVYTLETTISIHSKHLLYIIVYYAYIYIYYHTHKPGTGYTEHQQLCHTTSRLLNRS
jgi:hypothetical protein